MGETIKNNGLINILNINRSSTMEPAEGRKHAWPLMGISNVNLRGSEWNWEGTFFETGEAVTPGANNVPRAAQKGDRNVYIVVRGSEYQDAKLVNTVIDGNESFYTNNFKDGIMSTLNVGDEICAVDGKLTTVADAGAGAVAVFVVEQNNYNPLMPVPGGTQQKYVVLKKI